MSRVLPGPDPDPGQRVLVQVTAAMHAGFTACPHLTWLRDCLSVLQRDAAQLPAAEAARVEAISPFTATGLLLALSKESAPELEHITGSRRHWHLSVSETGPAGPRPAALPELLAWVMTGWPDAQNFIAHTPTDGAAVHAEIPSPE